MARVAAPTRGIQLQHDRLPLGGVLYMSNAPVFLELLQRHVHIAVGATATVPALWLFAGGSVDTLRVTRNATDSLTVGFPTVDYSIALAPDGSIFGVMSRPKTAAAGSSFRLVRRDCR